MTGVRTLANASLLAGPDLRYVPSADICIRDGAFDSIRPRDRRDDDDDVPGRDDVLDCEGFLVIPGLVDSHTHIGDSVGKDALLYGTVDEKIHPVMGLKARILARTPAGNLAEFMRNSCAAMLRRGITTFVDFREGGIAGVSMLRRALKGVPIRPIVLGRLDHYQDAAAIRDNRSPFPEKSDELNRLLCECDGIGISGANENSDAALAHYSGTRKLRAIHSSETEESVSRSLQVTGVSETARALALRPHFLVHMTHASGDDLRAVAASDTRGIVVCPRANSALAEGVPDVVGMQRAGCTLALGTDNVMVNPPDMFREMDYAWKMAMGMRKTAINPAEILKMATVNAGMLLGYRIGAIDRGMLADCVILDKHSIDLEPMHNPHAAVVHRTSESSIRAVMVGGEIVHGGL